MLQTNRQSLSGKFIAAFARIVLGAIFLYSGCVKLIDPAGFAQSISNYQLLPDILVPTVALFIASLEALCGLALMLNIWIGGATSLISGLLIIFMAAVGSALYRGLDISCGCFSASATAQGELQMTLLRDAALLILAGRIISTRSQKQP